MSQSQSARERQTTPEQLRLLQIENDSADAELCRLELKRAGFGLEADVVQVFDEFRERVDTRAYDVILADYNLPGWNGMEALIYLQQKRFNTPFILITGALGEEAAVECIKRGAADYVLKDRLARLPVAVRRSLGEKSLREERQQAEEALKDSEKRFRALIENSSDGIVLVRADGTFLYSSPGSHRLLGYTLRQLAGRNIFDFIHPDELGRAGTLFSHLAQGEGRTASIELRYRHKDGSWRWIEGVGKNLLAEPSVQAIVVNYRDVTERKQAEEKVQKSEERFQLVARTTNDVIWDWDTTADKIWYNEALETVLGYQPGKPGMGSSWWLDRVHPDDRDRVQMGVTDTFSSGRRAWSDEYRFRRADGSDGYFLNRATVIYDRQGKPVRMLGAMMDITDRKRAVDEVRRLNGELEQRVLERTAQLEVANRELESEIRERRWAEDALERLRHENELILNSVGEGICRIDLTRECTFVNPAAARMLGWDPKEFLHKTLDCVTGYSRADGKPLDPTEYTIYMALRDGTVHHSDNEVFYRKDGSSFPVEYVCTPILERSQLVGAVITFLDITDRRAVERMKDDFISIVSHELRTPLTSIRGALGLLASGRLAKQAGKVQRMLDVAVSNTDRLTRLINDILDIERMQSGRATLTREICDAGELMAQAADVVRSMAEEAGVMLSVTPESASLLVDRDRIIQTLTNLLSNAIKFSSAGAGVWLDAERRSGEIVFRVRDIGRGIPADKLESIFGRFQQVDASDSRLKGGTGLGLFICRSIVQQHGGRIWAESSMGNGSTLFVVLPLPSEADLESVKGRLNPPGLQGAAVRPETANVS